jgi:hypothetical protein
MPLVLTILFDHLAYFRVIAAVATVATNHPDGGRCAVFPRYADLPKNS